MITGESKSSQGTASIEPEPQPQHLFNEEMDNIDAAINISEEAKREAELAAEVYDLEEREKRLLAVELEYFGYNPRDEVVGLSYFKDYCDLETAILIDGGKDLAKQGWFLRWGAHLETVKSALKAKGISAYNLIYVFGNKRHEEILAEYKLNGRRFGRGQ